MRLCLAECLPVAEGDLTPSPAHTLAWLKQLSKARRGLCTQLSVFSLQPTKVLGIYTFTKRVALEEMENKPRKQQGYSTVSHFNIVHYDCHLAAVRWAWLVGTRRCSAGVGLFPRACACWHWLCQPGGRFALS